METCSNKQLIKRNYAWLNEISDCEVNFDHDDLDTNDKNIENKGNIDQVGGGIDDHSGCGSIVKMITIWCQS